MSEFKEHRYKSEIKSLKTKNTIKQKKIDELTERERSCYLPQLAEQAEKIDELEKKIVELENWHIQRGGQKIPMQACPYCDNSKRAYFKAKKKLAEAAKYLRIGKEKFAPHTTNSDVDVFLKSLEEKEGVSCSETANKEV